MTDEQWIASIADYMRMKYGCVDLPTAITPPAKKPRTVLTVADSTKTGHKTGQKQPVISIWKPKAELFCPDDRQPIPKLMSTTLTTSINSIPGIAVQNVGTGYLRFSGVECPAFAMLLSGEIIEQEKARRRRHRASHSVSLSVSGGEAS
jgi:hypothetical protein